MKGLPTANSDRSLFLRTDFSDDVAWEALCVAIQEPSIEGFVASFDYVNDPIYAGLGVEELLNLRPDEAGHYFLYVADAKCFANSECPILVVDLYTDPGRTIRVIQSEVCGVENNLSISNMDFEDFEDEAGPDGVFRGFTD